MEIKQARKKTGKEERNEEIANKKGCKQKESKKERMK